MKLLEVCEVTKRFGGLLALHRVRGTIEQGQITGLIGPNGAGKTTLFNLIAGEFAPDQGSILLQGEPLHRLPSNAICKRGIARTFQMVRPFLNLTTLRNVVMAASFGHTSSPGRQQAEPIAWHWLEFIGLADKAHLLARGLTLGERKRLEHPGSAVLLLHHRQHLDECANLPRGCRTVRGPWVHAGQPNRSQSDCRRTEHIIDRVIPHKPRLGRCTAHLGQGPGKNARIRLLDLHGLGDHDGGQIGANLQLLNFRLLAPYHPVGDHPEPNPLRVERGERLLEPGARHR